MHERDLEAGCLWLLITLANDFDEAASEKRMKNVNSTGANLLHQHRLMGKYEGH